MSNTQDIRRALEQQLNSGSYTGITNSTDISWENVAFDPTGKDVWMSARLLIAEQIPSVIGSGLSVRWTGLFNINCYAKQNNGTSEIDDLADDVLAQFPYGTQITENSKIINIRFAESFGTINDPPWIIKPVQLTWYAHIS